MTDRDDSWMSAEMLAAERAFDTAVDAAYHEMQKTDDLLAELEAEAEGQLEAEAAVWEAHANRDDASAPWRRLAERARDGGITWLDIAAGRCDDDPDVRAAMDADSAAFHADLADRAGPSNPAEKPDQPA